MTAGALVFWPVGIDHYGILRARRRHGGLGLVFLWLFHVLAGFAHALGHLIFLTSSGHPFGLDHHAPLRAQTQAHSAGRAALNASYARQKIGLVLAQIWRKFTSLLAV